MNTIHSTHYDLVSFNFLKNSKIISFVTILLFLFLSKAYAQVCPEGSYLVSGHPRQAHYRSAGTHVSSSIVSPYCRNYRDDGPLKKQFRKKKPKDWPHKKERFKKCSKEKQEKVSKILSSLPKILTNVGKLKIYCPSKSETPNNPATSVPEEKIISLYDSSFRMDTKRVVIHELAHILWSRLSDKEKESYYKASNWISFEETFIINRTSFSAPDGKLNPEEDFSNNIEYKLVEPKYFKKKFPKINSWINKLFGDKK